MNQKELSEYVFTKIIKRFKSLQTFKYDDIVDIEYKSPKGRIILRLTTQENEITLGFASGKKLGWHKHMDQFGVNTPDEQLELAFELIEDIIMDKKTIVYSSVKGYFMTDDIEGLEEFKEKDEIIQTFYWSDL